MAVYRHRSNIVGFCNYILSFSLSVLYISHQLLSIGLVYHSIYVEYLQIVGIISITFLEIDEGRRKNIKALSFADYFDPLIKNLLWYTTKMNRLS